MKKTGLRIALVLTLVLGSSVFAGSALAKNDGGTRPGWGHGDKNHHHTGPPGQSTQPSNETHSENNVSVQNESSQSASSGNASSHGGSATSGDASNSNSTSTTVTTTNSSSSQF